jgi:hypothetical protein
MVKLMAVLVAADGSGNGGAAGPAEVGAAYIPLLSVSNATLVTEGNAVFLVQHKQSTGRGVGHIVRLAMWTPVLTILFFPVFGGSCAVMASN